MVIDYPGADDPATYYGETKVVLPAGEQKVTVEIGEGEVSETIQLAAGQTVEKDIIVGVGHVVANAFYVAGGDKVDVGGLTFHVVKAKKKIDGTREEVLTTYGAGRQVRPAARRLRRRHQPGPGRGRGAVQHQVRRAKELNVSLNAGVLAISAPGASAIRVLEQKKDIQGNRKELAVGYDENFQTTMPAGDYAIVAEKPRQWRHQGRPATVKAGERTEVTVQ